jgi:hypothetical protein
VDHGLYVGNWHLEIASKRNSGALARLNLPDYDLDFMVGRKGRRDHILGKASQLARKKRTQPMGSVRMNLKPSGVVRFPVIVCKAHLVRLTDDSSALGG